MDNYFKTVNNCVTIESYILNHSKPYLERSLCKIILSSLSKTNGSKFYFEIGISILCFRRRPQQIGLCPLHCDVEC